MHKRFKVCDDNREYIIEEDSSYAGWCLYIYENGYCIKDHFKDSLNALKNLARIKYFILETAWKPL